MKRLDERFYIRKDADTATQKFSASKKAYAGQVYFLVDAANSSGAFYLARLAKSCGIGTLVGQTTGGSQQGLNAGIILFLRLPNSKIEADIPLLGTFPRSPQPAGGIEPDIFVEPSVQALLEGRDLELEAALRAQ